MTFDMHGSLKSRHIWLRKWPKNRMNRVRMLRQFDPKCERPTGAIRPNAFQGLLNSFSFRWAVYRIFERKPIGLFWIWSRSSCSIRMHKRHLMGIHLEKKKICEGLLYTLHISVQQTTFLSDFYSKRAHSKTGAFIYHLQQVTWQFLKCWPTRGERSAATI